MVVTKQWRQQALAWSVFLTFGLLSTLSSPFPIRSFLGHGITADGWLYWFLLSGFTLTNSLVLQHYHKLFYWQIRGILVGITLIALSAYPQLIDWKIDYTIHSGQLWPETSHVLATAVYRNHQPISLYSHKGIAGFTLALGAVLGLVALRKELLAPIVALVLTALYAVTLSLMQVRGAMLAMLAGWLWIVVTVPYSKRIKRTLIILSVIGVISFGWATAERRITNAELYASTPLEAALKHFTSDRVYLWQKSWRGFIERPWVGWGFSGYSIVYADRACPKGTSLTELGDYEAFCQRSTGERLMIPTGSTKAHNLFVDEFLSLGILGANSYFALLVVYARKSPQRNGISVPLFVVYLVYTLTWFDCGQISHLGWWALSGQIEGSIMPELTRVSHYKTKR
ncbi:MAG: O-antigen ligase family protein [Phormidesmis sp. RL_2_1]|nr:O-antigen ligase family protein [Phormidesmis sp. RL_2_1]